MSFSLPIIKLLGQREDRSFYSVAGKVCINRASAHQLMANYDPAYADIGAFNDFVSALEPLSLEQVKLHFKKPKKAPISMQALYLDCRDKLPVIFNTCEDGTRSNYLIKDNRELTLVHDKTEDSLLSSFQSVPSLYARIRDYYDNALILEEHRAILPFETWLMHMLVQLKYDIAKRVELDDIRNLSWSATDYAFKKFDPIVLQSGPTPAWDEFLQRLDYPDVFMSWVWSCFDPDCYIRQVMWLRGAGNDGKSAVMRSLCSIYGQKYSAALKANAESQNWFFSDVYGKGLVMYGDVQNVHLINNVQIKSLTGGDFVQIEGKNVSSFSGRVHSNLIVGSNPMPRINPDDESQRSRLIKLEVMRPGEGTKDVQFEQRLIAEGPAFLARCKSVSTAYITEGGTRISLPPDLDAKILRDCVDEQSHLLDSFIEDRLEFGEAYFCRNSDFLRELSDYLIAASQDSSKAKFMLESFQRKADRGEFTRGRYRLGPNTAKELAYVGFRVKGRTECILTLTS